MAIIEITIGKLYIVQSNEDEDDRYISLRREPEISKPRIRVRGP